MAWTGKQTDHGDGTKHVQVWDENGQLIYDATADLDTVFTGPVDWTGAFPPLNTCCEGEGMRTFTHTYGDLGPVDERSVNGGTRQ